MSPSLSLRPAARSTFVSHFGLHGDHSALLVRERPRETAEAEVFALHGAFDPAAADRLAAALRGLSPSALPLTLDLRGVSALDEALPTRLLKLHRELSLLRPVSFLVADDGPVPALLCRLGLEERFGVGPAKRLPPLPPAVPVFPLAEKPAPRDYAVS